MNRLANKTVSANGIGSAAGHPAFGRSIELLANVLAKLGLIEARCGLSSTAGCDGFL
jgi:hypothetical protein